MTHGELVQILLSTIWLDDTGRQKQAQYILERYDLVRRETSVGPNERPPVSVAPVFSTDPGSLPLSTQLKAALITEEAREKTRTAEREAAERQARARPSVDPGHVMTPEEIRQNAAVRGVDPGRVALPGEPRSFATGGPLPAPGHDPFPGDPLPSEAGPLPGAMGPVVPTFANTPSAQPVADPRPFAPVPVRHSDESLVSSAEPDTDPTTPFPKVPKAKK